MKSLSLLWRILISTSLAITAIFGVIAWVVQGQFVRIASGMVEDEVRASFHAYESLWKARQAQLASVSRVLSRMPDVRAAFSTGDPATISDTAREVWDRISQPGTLFLVTDPKGAVIAGLGAAPAGAFRTVPAVAEAAASFPRQATGFVVENGQLFQIVITPVYVASGPGEGLLNVLVAGIAVDAEMARELKQATGGSEFVFVSKGTVVASTLAGNNEPRSDFAEFKTPLRDVKGRAVGELQILRSSDAARRRIASLRAGMIAAWAVAVLLGFALTYLMARRILQPVRALDSAASEIARGNYGVEVPVTGRDELGRLARTFNSMCSSIRAAREELIHKERISTIGRLSTSIIHDLRNPLASIYGGAEMLVDSDLSEGQVKRLASNIYRASRRMQELLQELADATRGAPHAREMCQLREVIEAGRDTVSQLAAKHNVAIEIDVPDGLEAPLDRSPMERVFQNLFGNAVEAMPNGGRVRVSTRRAEADVLVSVEDDGPGIPEAIARQLFQPFVTGGKKNGIGLGLALSRETVKEHGGDLWADRSTPQGARFVVRIPLRTGESDSSSGHVVNRAGAPTG